VLRARGGVERACCNTARALDSRLLLQRGRLSVARLMAGSMTLRAEVKKPGSSSWIVVDIWRGSLKTPTDRWRWCDGRRPPSTGRIPMWLKDITNSEAYRPQMVSLGPFHHGEPDLLPMEVHKRRAMLHRAMRSGKPLGDLVAGR
jgi:hypothetical protein